MAQEKKAFVVYVDWESQFNLLSDEEAGKLIKHIFSYVNDKEPEFNPDERLLTMAFDPIKKQLKRDLKKYEGIKQKRSEAGKKSAELRASQSQQVLTSVDFVEHDSTNVNKAQQASTNPTVTVTDIVKDTVIVTDTVTVKDSVINTIGDPHTKFSNSFGKQPIETLKKNCAGHTTWLESIGMRNSILIHQVMEWYDSFCLHILASGKTEETESEFKKFCSSWISSEIRQGRKPKVENQNKDAPKKTALEIAQEVIIEKHGNRSYEN